MQYDEFIERVQARGEIDSRETAQTATAATLETLSERLTRDERRNLAAELPDELKEIIFRRQETTYFLLKDFYNRVAARADVRVPEAIAQSQAVVAVLQEAISTGQLNAILELLPDEYDELFVGAPYGPGSPSA